MLKLIYSAITLIVIGCSANQIHVASLAGDDIVIYGRQIVVVVNSVVKKNDSSYCCDGVVKDSASNVPLKYNYIRNLNSNINYKTDSLGQFSICSLSRNDTLVFTDYNFIYHKKLIISEAIKNQIY